MVYFDILSKWWEWKRKRAVKRQACLGVKKAREELSLHKLQLKAQRELEKAKRDLMFNHWIEAAREFEAHYHRVSSCSSLADQAVETIVTSPEPINVKRSNFCKHTGREKYQITAGSSVLEFTGKEHDMFFFGEEVSFNGVKAPGMMNLWARLLILDVIRGIHRKNIKMLPTQDDIQ